MEREAKLAQLMQALPPTWRGRWCGATEDNPCACLGCADGAGGLVREGFTEQDWRQYFLRKRSEPKAKHVLPESRRCDHCGRDYIYSTICQDCLDKGHEESLSQRDCPKCVAFFARGKIPMRDHLCVHCEQSFKMRGVPCNLCPKCFEAGHRGSIPKLCGKCKRKES